jgi:hypothetical protein
MPPKNTGAKIVAYPTAVSEPDGKIGKMNKMIEIEIRNNFTFMKRNALLPCDNNKNANTVK